jgi:hypothetical protein
VAAVAVAVAVEAVVVAAAAVVPDREVLLEIEALGRGPALQNQ